MLSGAECSETDVSRAVTAQESGSDRAVRGLARWMVALAERVPTRERDKQM